MPDHPDLPPAADPMDWLNGSEMGRLIKSIDWAGMPLGPIEHWPQSLRTAVSICLDSRHPIVLWWGPERTMFYNDGYRPMLGDSKHPQFMGGSGRGCWAEIWDIIGPMMDEVIATGRAIWSEDLRLLMRRSGYLEECYFTFSYSPIRDERGRPCGIFNACSETTGRVLSQRRLKMLREMAVEARTADEASRLCAEIIGRNPHDIPFALIYLVDDSGKRLRLAAQAGLAAGGPASPLTVELAERDADGWPLTRVVAQGVPELVETLTARFGELPGAPWDQSPHQAMVLPIARPGRPHPTGVLVLAISPRRAFDDDYRGFFDLTTGHVATALANARAYEEERRNVEALAEIDRAKTIFFANISHEFRTPLTLMLGPIEDALGDGSARLPAVQHDRLEVAHRNAQRLLKLVNTLLDFSRIEAGRAEASFKPTDLARMTAELASHFRSACDKAGLRLVIDCPPLDQPVHVDGEMWEKIVLNLLSNAFKFTLAGDITVRLRAERGLAELTVRDTGTGIPEHELPRLFERFHRIEGAAGRSFEGSGIGLALVQELVRLHGGTIRADSTIGVGSSFHVALPLGSAHLPADRVDTAPAFASTTERADAFVEDALRWLPDDGNGAPRRNQVEGQGRDGMRPRLLLADDNADMRAYVRHILAGIDCEVETVGDGEAALAAACAIPPPDLVLTDVMMPGLDGLALLRALRADHRTKGIPVILLSARADAEARVEGFSSGADAYMVKPFSRRELVARVEGCLRLAKLRRDKLNITEGIYRAIGESIDYGVWVCSPDGRNTYASPSFLKMAGITQQQCSDFGWIDLLHPDDVEHTAQAWRDCVRSEGNWDIEHRVRGADGKWHLVLARGVPVRDESGEIAFWAGINLDISGIKEAEAALRQAKAEAELALAEAERANLAKSKFLAAASHDLRQPVQSLVLLLDVLKTHASTPLVAKALDAMEGALEGLNGLLTSILDISRIDAGVITPQMRSVDIGGLLLRLCAEYQPLCEPKGLTLRCHGKAGLHARSDAALLERAVRNLIENAIRYTDRGGLLVAVRRRGDRLRIDIVDSGIGIPANKLGQIFEEFYQIANPARDHKLGLGLGLAIVNRLASLIGAEMRVRSNEGRGSCFTMSLPSGAASLELPAPDARVRIVSGRRIMVIEDNPKVRMGLQLLLESWNCQVVGAKTGEEAIELGERDGWHLDAIISDYRLGAGMSGTTAAAEIRRRAGRVVPTLIITGDTAPERIVEAHSSGFEMLHKPVMPDELARKMVQMLAS